VIDSNRCLVAQEYRDNNNSGTINTGSYAMASMASIET
jgi:hypothetical protein